MRIIKRRITGRHIFLIFIALPAIAYLFSQTSNLVMGYQEQKHAHIFPTSVESDGWDDQSNALNLDLPSRAPYGSFNADNSAIMQVAASTSTHDLDSINPATINPPSLPLESTSSATSTAPAPFFGPTSSPALLPVTPPPTPANTQSPSPDQTPPPAPVESAPPTPIVVPDSTTTLLEIETESSSSAPVDLPLPIIDASSSIPDDASTTTDANSATSTSMRSLPQVLAQGIARAAQFTLAQVIQTAYATTTPALIDASTTLAATTTPPILTATSSAPVVSDASSTDESAPPSDLSQASDCIVLGTACHVIQFSGFNVAGSLTDKHFRGAQLNFSLASLSGDLGVDGKLSVRFFHGGRWHSAGEIYLNKQLSNESNGGYFSETLDGINSWDDLSDVKIVFEYVPGDGSSGTEIYLDAVWIDGEYVEPIQNMLSGQIANPSDVPQNVNFDLPIQSADSNVLVQDDGTKILFSYLEHEGPLTLRTDKISYRARGAGADVYMSVTNTTNDKDSFKLYLSTPGGKGSLSDLQEYMNEVPVASSTPIVDDITYFCEAGWQASTSTEGDYSCALSREHHVCDSLNDAGDQCVVHGDTVGYATSTQYVNTWVERPLNMSPADEPTVKGDLPKGYKIASGSNDPFDIMPGQTVYFKLHIATPDSTRARFVVSAVGTKTFGDLDSMRLYNETVQSTARASSALRKPRLNDELDGKSDYDATEQPSFKFRFRSQRGLFTKIKDALFRVPDSYTVKKVQVTRLDGSDPHVPVDVQYDSNNQWTLDLGKEPRQFQPGRYSVDFTVDEDGQSYTDSVDFYWGVLAINPDKTVYASGETSHLSMAALNDDGDTMCDANLDLTVRDPTGATTDVPVISGGGCGINNVTDLPDFVADYATGRSGEYSLTLSRLDDTGAVANSITDSFEVQDDPQYSVERHGPTRIYPYSAYMMHIGLTPKSSFKGMVQEIVPEGFIVKNPSNGGQVIRKDGVLYVDWNVDLRPGQSIDLSYQFKAPEASPYLFKLGQASLINPGGTTLFSETRQWQIASDATLIATGVAWVNATSTTNGANLNNINAFALQWTGGEFDTSYFATSTANPTQLSVQQSGDYLVALDVPVLSAFAGNNRDIKIEADIRVNGTKINEGVGRTYVERRNNASNVTTDGSAHVYMLLHNLHQNDYIEAFAAATTTVNAADTVTIPTQASMYVEYIPSSETVFQAVATSTATSSAATWGVTNLNNTATSSLVWWDTGYRYDTSGYTHNNTSTPQNVTLKSAGNYMVMVNLPTNGAVTDARTRGAVLLNGVEVKGSYLSNAYISNVRVDNAGSSQWSGVVMATTTNTPLRIDLRGISGVGTTTIGPDQASIYVQKLPSSDIYFGRATTTSSGTNWNAAAASNILWEADDIIDAADYTHSTNANQHQITVVKPGDYLLAFNDSVVGAVTGANPLVSVLVNGTARSGALAESHYVANTSGDVQSSGSLVYLLRNLNPNDVISLQTVQDGSNAGTLNTNRDALLMLWHKSAQSSYTQQTEQWFENLDSATTTSNPWPGLGEGDSITTGNAATSTTAMDIRIALNTSVTTTANADSFKLQYAAGSTCSPALSWTDVDAIGGTGIWRGYDNPSVADGATTSITDLQLTDPTLGQTTVPESYEESNPSVAAPNSIPAGQLGEWSWRIQDNGAADGTSYCFRMVNSNGQVLKNYTDYPQLITNSVPNAPTQISPFDNEKQATTTPWFTFTATDDNGNDINYDVQISTDPLFGSTLLDETSDSTQGLNDYDNLTTPSDKEPFNSGGTIRFKDSTVTLTNGTTYYWRVRGTDPAPGSGDYGNWSSVRSFTVDTSVTQSTWFQTTNTQFNNDTLLNTEATTSVGNGDVGLSGSNATGQVYSQEIDYSDHTAAGYSGGNSWGTISWHNATTSGTIVYHVEYLSATGTWAIIPDSDLSGNNVGTTSQPFNISGLDPNTYSAIRVRADFTKTLTTPRLQDLTVTWALSVAAPTLPSPFDNEKISTTTPDLKFTTTDPQSDALVYQVQWSTDPTFTAGVTTRISDTNTGFTDLTNSGSVSPFPSGDSIDYHLQNAERLASSTTFWWRVRAKDPGGGNAYSLWSSSQSFTTDTTVQQSTWYQTTSDQFNTDTLSHAIALGGDLTVATDTGKIAIYRANVAGESPPLNTASPPYMKNTWDTTTRQDSIFSLNGNTDVLLKTGYYAIMYGIRFDSSAGVATEPAVQSGIVMSSSTVSGGWSTAALRSTNGSNEGYASGGTIVKVTTDNTPLYIESFRTDISANTVTRVNNTSGIQVMRLDSSWNYARLSRATRTTGPTSLSSWTTVNYDREDEIDTTAYSHSAGAGPITLLSAGHYLVFANTYGGMTTAGDSVVDGKLTLNGYDLPGSFTTTHFRANATDAAREGAVTIGMIIQATTSNEVLRVQLKRSVGTQSWTIDADKSGAYVDRTALTIVKIPEADFIQLRNSTTTVLNPAVLTPLSWDTEIEKDASFAHANATSTRITINTPGDYLFFNANLATSTSASNEFYQLWRKNGAAQYDPYGQAIGFVDTVAANAGAWSAHIFPSLVANDYVESIVMSTSTNSATMHSNNKALEGVRIGSLNEADTNPKTILSTPIVFSSGAGPKWAQASSSADTPGASSIKYQIEYTNASSTGYALIPDADLASNSTGLTMPVTLSSLSRTKYTSLELLATLSCASGNCPTLHEWQVTWSPGINVSGTIKTYDQQSNVTSGTVSIAVNGVLSTKTGIISGSGTWQITGVNAFTGDVLTAFVTGASGATRAVGVTEYTGSGDVTGFSLYQNSLALGSDDNSTVTNSDIGKYDNSVSNNSAIFDEDDAGNDLTVCAIAGCGYAKLVVRANTIYEPSAGTSVFTYAPEIQIDGTLIADGNTIVDSGSWRNDGAFIKNSSTVIFNATSTTEYINSTSATSTGFNIVTFATSSGAARWNLYTPLFASSTVSVNFGTLAMGATSTIWLGGDLTFGASGAFVKNTATTTFVGTATSTLTDNTAAKQDLGYVTVDGAAKGLQLGSDIKATSIIIGADDALDASGSNFNITLFGDWTNNNLFYSRTGTVTFAATTTNRVINPGVSSFYNITFNGSGGNWSFSTPNATSTNNFTITTGTLTMPTATTTIGGSFSNAATFSHNNGTIALNASSGSKTITAGGSNFFNLAFTAGASWTITDTNATSSGDVMLSAGTLIAPHGVLEIGRSFTNTGGALTSNGGTLRFTAGSARTVKLGGSDAYNLTFAGTGPFSFLDTNATSTATVRFENGATTLPSGVFTIGGSFLSVGGTFSNNSGTAKFNATTTGFSITPASSIFATLLFNSNVGGWTITGNATSTASTTIQNVRTLTLASGSALEVDGGFNNFTQNASTTWTNTTLYLNSGTAYTINDKNSSSTYATLKLGLSTAVRTWGSSASSVVTTTGSSLYSQNNAGVSGALYIYGAWTSSSNEYWSYATDFDGTALAGAARRQVSVRVASSSNLQFNTSTLQIIGDPAASTTIANQGTGFYSFLVAGSGAHINAQYYTVASTSAMGLGLSGNTTIDSMNNGDFTLTYSGGSMISASSTIIDQNPDLQITQVRFATTSVLGSGSFNVTETGTPSPNTNFLWFRKGYGNMYGEAFDNDPGPGSGNPGYIQFDDSGFTINVSGHVYSDHGVTPIGASVCDGTNDIQVITDLGATFNSSCNAGTGAYTVPNVTFRAGATFAVYIKGKTNKYGVTVTKSATADLTNMDVYQNAAILRHEDAGPITTSDIANVDSSHDSDIRFTVSGNDLTVKPDSELYIWPGKNFTPSGNVTLSSGGSGLATDGRLWLALGATTTMTGNTQTFTIGGGLHVDTAALLSTASSTFVFNATTTGKSILANASTTFWNLTFNGAGGQWSLDSAAGSATSTVANTFTFSAGTIVGDGDLVLQSGGLTGGGTFTMTGGTVRLEGTGNFGNSNNWQFYNLTLGNGTAASSTKTGTATTTIMGVFKISASDTLNAGSSAWVLSGSSTPFSLVGTLNVMSAPFTYNSSSATNVAAATYANLFLSPASAGSPTYTLLSGLSLSPNNLQIGDGVNGVTVSDTANDASIAIGGDLTISSGATFIASDLGGIDITVAGSWTNNGTFTNNSRKVTFNGSQTGKTVNAGTSPFYDLVFNNASGGWTITSNATSSHDTTLTAFTNFTLNPNKTLEVDGTFTNSVGGAQTTWATSTLYLNSGTSYTINGKFTGGDVYGTLQVGANTNIRDWASSESTTTTATTGSLYAMNYASSSGALNVYGAYTRSSGADYWDYATDFDGTSIAGSPRTVTVSIASSSSIVLNGTGLLDIVGGASATTTIQNQGSGAYFFMVAGGTFTANYYAFRNLEPTYGLNFVNAPTINSLSFGDFQSAASGTMMTVAGSVIDATQAQLGQPMVIKNVRFATSSGITGGYNVTATSTTSSYWKFNLHYGNRAGEAFDNDAGGDPGYIRWDDSNIAITISGKLYTDEGTTIDTVGCDGVTNIVKIVVEGANSYQGPCNHATGVYSIGGVIYNPGDTFTVYLASSTIKSATVTRGLSASSTDMDIYEHRVILRTDDATPLTIAAMDQWDSGQDANVPFLATQAATNTLVVIPNTKLIVWTGKNFTPAGNVTLQSGGSGTSYDGSLELYPASVFTAATTQQHSIGGSFTIDNNATMSAANSTFTFTATTTGKTISVSTSTFYKVVFNGGGGNWAFSAPATSTSDFTINNGTVTLPSGTLYVGGSFVNSGSTGGFFMHNNGTLVLNSTASGNSVQVATSSLYNLTVNGTGGTWSFLDTNATSSNDVLISNGSITFPKGVLAVGGSFTNAATFSHNAGTVQLFAVTSGKTVKEGTSNFYKLRFLGVGGSWTMTDSSATVVSDFTVATGTVALPQSALTVGGSFLNTGTFTTATDTVTMNATTTGFSITPGNNTFYNLTLNSAAGGWTITQSATTTNNFTLAAAASFTQTATTTLAVGGIFTNSVGGAPTTWTNSNLYLYSGTAYSINTRSNTGDLYGTLIISSSSPTQISMWGSSAATTTVGATSYLYSQNHAGVTGSLYIYGAYTKSSGTDYWSAATDFDGTDLSGSPRQVSVHIATSSSVSYSGATLNIVGTSTATTTIRASGTSTYSFALNGGTLNANYYDFRNMDSSGVQILGTPTVSNLSNGYLEISVASGTAMTLAGTAIDTNASASWSQVAFATTSANLRGYNVTLSGSAGKAWTFTGAYGNFAGEAYDSDGSTSCGHIRWDDSNCLFVSESHYRWRNDDGGEGVPTSNWYNVSWSKRQRIGITNSNGTSYTNIPVKINVPYAASMQANFNDLRFTDSSGTTTLTFWRESTINSATSTVWVQVPSLPGSGSAVIYMYYGNGSATAADSTTTFPYLEDFEANTLSAYSGSDSTLFQTNAAYNHNGSYGLSAKAGNEASRTNNGGIFKTNNQTAQNDTIRWFQYMNNDAGGGFDTDEPCTFFGFQSAGNDLAICLEEFPTAKQRIEIVRGVKSNDNSGNVMASTSVTYTTGWYEVVVDWLSSAINVNLYNAAGTDVATINLSTTTPSYTPGGYGFGFNDQHGGWDTFMVKQYTAVTPTYNFGPEQVNGGASWAAAEDAADTTLLPNQNIRLRFNIQNSGTAVSGQQYLLQYAEKGSALTCEAVSSDQYFTVPQSTSCGTAEACMSASSQFSDLSSTTPLMTFPGTMSYTYGQMMQGTHDQTNALSQASSTATEVEYNFQMTSFASQNNYCFRVYDSGHGQDLANYDNVAAATILHPPMISNIGLNVATSSTMITLVEGTTTPVFVTATSTDLNGFSDMVFATGTIYRYDVTDPNSGPSCTANDNNCYQIASTSCSFSACSGNQCTVTCKANIQYFADPTDTDNGNATTTYFGKGGWRGVIAVQDTTALRDTKSTAASSTDMATLRALEVTTGGINFGGPYAPGTVATTTATTTVQNTGNVNIDVDVAGTNLGSGSSPIPVGQQKYATSTFQYASCSICQFLSGAATPVNVTITKPTSSTTAATSSIYFGLNIPSTTNAGTLQGTNTFTAVKPGGG